MHIIELEQGSQPWKEYRLSHIGSSDSPIIMRESIWTSPYQLWTQKVTGSQTPENEAMRLGKEREGIARKMLEELIEVELAPLVLLHSEIDYMIASMDAVNLEEGVAIEIKCPGGKTHEVALSKRIPEYYKAQLQHQLEVCQLDKMLYVSYNPDHMEPLVVVDVYRDQPYINKLLKEEAKFYDCIKSFVAPELTNKDYASRNDITWSIHAQDLKRIRAQRKYFEMMEEETEKKLIKEAQGQSSEGHGIRLSKIVRKGNIDYPTILQEHKIDGEKYRKSPTEYWKISEYE